MSRVRRAAKAGTWYEGNKQSLMKQIHDCCLHHLGPGVDITKNGHDALQPDETKALDILGLISPHAGYMYSGPVAAHGFSHLARAKPHLSRVIILGPNHTGLGRAPIGVYPAPGAWETPLGRIEIDEELTMHLLEIAEKEGKNNVIFPDELAHSQEHSLELQVPFLQYFLGNDWKLTAVCMFDQDWEACLTLAQVITSALQELSSLDDVAIVASSDFNHYLDHETTVRKDFAMIDPLLTGDAKRMNEARIAHDVTACGYGPITTLMLVANKLGYRHYTLLKHATSGEVSGDKSFCVGYASILVAKQSI